MTARIADLALLSDCQGAALVDRDGAVVWWCAPRFDSRACFARLLDPGGGHFRVGPADPAGVTVERRYRPGTLVLETTFRTPTGAVRLTDALAFGRGERDHGIGMGSPHRLLRVLDGLEGEVDVAVEFRPGLEYGLARPRLHTTPDGRVVTVGGPDTLTLVPTDPEERLVVRAGQRAAWAVQHEVGMRAAPVEDVGDVPAHLDDTAAGWRSWIEHHTGYEGPHADAVRHASVVLQGLTYAPSGAIVAAPTTSLPEVPGGRANWDYRYAWLRDAAFTLRALWIAACPTEVDRYFGWMSRAAGPGSDGGHVQIVFGVEGERDLSERELGHLAGFAGAAPARVGNEAWRQEQLDVMGEVLDAAALLADRFERPLDPEVRRFLLRLADAAAERWRGTDSGIWEGREGERHYVTSKVYCWVALDRAVRLAALLEAPPEQVATWERERDAVRAETLERGWDDGVGAFTGAFDSDHLDVGVLLMPLVGFLEATDPRMRATIERVARELGDDGLLFRWTGNAEEGEGAFVLASYWLVECLVRLGERDRARALFERVSAHANDVGLLSEEVDPRTGDLLGNFPQGLAHIGLINAAWALAGAGGEEEAR